MKDRIDSHNSHIIWRHQWGQHLDGVMASDYPVRIVRFVPCTVCPEPYPVPHTGLGLIGGAHRSGEGIRKMRIGRN